MSYVVTGPCVIAKDQEGRNQHRYEGDVITWLSDEQADHFLQTGLVEETDSGVGGSDPAEGGGDEKPAATAKKADLVAWLVDNAVDEDGADYDAAELDTLTKDQLWDRINSVE